MVITKLDFEKYYNKFKMLEELDSYIPDSMYQDNHIVWTVGEIGSLIGYRLSYIPSYDLCSFDLQIAITNPSTGSYLSISNIPLSEFKYISVEQDDDGRKTIVLNCWNGTNQILPID